MRYSLDQRPVISHDPHLRRLFCANTRLGDLDLHELQKKFPLIPTLEEVVHRYGGRLHLMLELKQDNTGLSKARLGALKSILADLKPVDQYHLLAPTPDLLSQVDFAPPKLCCLWLKLTLDVSVIWL